MLDADDAFTVLTGFCLLLHFQEIQDWHVAIASASGETTRTSINACRILLQKPRHLILAVLYLKTSPDKGCSPGSVSTTECPASFMEPSCTKVTSLMRFAFDMAGNSAIYQPAARAVQLLTFSMQWTVILEDFVEFNTMK